MHLKTIFPREQLISANYILAYLVLLKLLIHFFTMSEYGLHRDEFLYLAMGERLDWGYLEVPPSIAFMARFTRAFLGDSVFAIRLLPVISGAFIVLLTGLMARELGGGRFAQGLAALAVVVSPAYLRSTMLFMPVVFDQLYWVAGAYLTIKILKSGEDKWWLVLGVLSGIALMNKYTMLLFGFGLFIGLLLTPQRRMLLCPSPWQAALIALCIFMPNLIWQHIHGWPVFEHMQALSKHQFIHVQSAGFLLMQFLMNLFTAPVWILGIHFFLFSKAGKPYRVIGWIYVTAITVLLLFSGKAYYLLPVYPMLFAGGAVLFEKHLASAKRFWLKPALISVILFGNIILIPYGVPVLPIEKMTQYAQFLAKNFGLWEPLRWENGEIQRLPQEFADMFGWENQAATVATVYRQLSTQEQAESLILASNYGEAGAIDFYRNAYSLPEVISFKGSYYLWGPGVPLLCPLNPVEQRPAAIGAVLITIGIPEAALKDYYEEVAYAATITHQYARENNVPIFICRNPKFSLEEIWEKLAVYRF